MSRSPRLPRRFELSPLREMGSPYTTLATSPPDLEVFIALSGAVSQVSLIYNYFWFAVRVKLWEVTLRKMDSKSCVRCWWVRRQRSFVGSSSPLRLIAIAALCFSGSSLMRSVMSILIGIYSSTSGYSTLARAYRSYNYVLTDGRTESLLPSVRFAVDVTNVKCAPVEFQCCSAVEWNIRKPDKILCNTSSKEIAQEIAEDDFSSVAYD